MIEGVIIFITGFLMGMLFVIIEDFIEEMKKKKDA